ncbi:MAG: hypothetical protein ACRDF0_04530 [Candidatus Limnocylindria bacterium]
MVVAHPAAARALYVGAVRYRIGDFGATVAGQCNCGRALPLLADVAGRAALSRSSGTAELVEELAILIGGDFRVVQESAHSFTLIVSAALALTDRHAAAFRIHIGREVTLKTMVRPELFLSPGANEVRFVSRVPRDENVPQSAGLER